MQNAPNLIQQYKKLNHSLQEYEIPMYFVQGPPGSSRERVKMKIDLVSIKICNFHDSRMSHNYFHLFNYYSLTELGLYICFSLQ